MSQEPPLANQIIDYTGGVASITLGAQTRYVRLQNDSICSMSFTGTNAATTDARSPAENIRIQDRSARQQDICHHEHLMEDKIIAIAVMGAIAVFGLLMAFDLLVLN